MPASHTAYMDLAARKAARHLGMTGDNPSVGAVIVKDNRVIGIGATSLSGRPHAEIVALHMAGTAAKDADLYVTLEPCAHHGRSGPCADAIIAAGIARVICAWQDPNPLVAGQGFSRLREAGIEVIAIDHIASFSTLAPFFSRMVLKRPRFLVKLATSIDGRIATHTGSSQWISNASARQYGQALRLKSDGILVGVGTVLADDPALSVRLKGFEAQSPRPIILDSHARAPRTANLFSDERETIVATLEADISQHASRLTLPPNDEGQVNLSALATALGDFGMNSVMIEGGGKVIASFMKAGLVDEFVHITGAKAIGGDGIAGLGSLGVSDISDTPELRLTRSFRLGDDIISHYVPEIPAVNPQDFLASRTANTV